MACGGLVLYTISFTMTYELKARREFEECASFSSQLGVGAGVCQFSGPGEMIFLSWGVHLFSLHRHGDR